MVRNVAFLRGINVGGHKVTKVILQKVFKTLGFDDVATFKQSGNVIFEVSEENTQKLSAKIETALESRLGYDIPVFIRSVSQLKTIIESDAFKGQNAVGSSFLVTFLAEETDVSSLQTPLTIPKSTAEVIKIKGREVYSVTHGGGEGALPNPFVESKLKVRATTRNLNVLVAIVEKYG